MRGYRCVERRALSVVALLEVFLGALADALADVLLAVLLAALFASPLAPLWVAPSAGLLALCSITLCAPGVLATGRTF